MKALAIALIIIGYALFYSGASNLFSGGQGWGFLQALLNKGTENQSGSIPNALGGSSGKSGSSGSSGTKSLLQGLGRFFEGVDGLL